MQEVAVSAAETIVFIKLSAATLSEVGDRRVLRLDDAATKVAATQIDQGFMRLLLRRELNVGISELDTVRERANEWKH